MSKGLPLGTVRSDTLLNSKYLFSSMANLLSKFRIDYSDVIVIPDVAKKAAESSRMEFDQMVEDFKEKSKDDVDKPENGEICGLVFSFLICYLCDFHL